MLLEIIPPLSFNVFGTLVEIKLAVYMVAASGLSILPSGL